MVLKSNFDKLVTVFGGSGFLGRHVVRALAMRHYRIRVAVRRPELTGHLQPLGRVGQIHAVQANLRFADSVEAAVRDADAVINLVGILYEKGRQRFDAVQAEGAETVARAAASAGASLVHISAIGADENSPSHYARSKAAGERLVLAAEPSAVDHAAVFRVRPGGWVLQPLCGDGKHLADPAASGRRRRAIPAGLRRRRCGSHCQGGGRRRQAGHDLRTRRPRGAHFKELMEFMLATIERRRLLVPVPFPLMKLQAAFLQFLPNPPLTPDQVEMLKADNVVSAAAHDQGRTLEGLGIIPNSMASVVPDYLWRFRKTGQFHGRMA